MLRFRSTHSRQCYRLFYPSNWNIQYFHLCPTKGTIIDFCLFHSPLVPHWTWIRLPFILLESLKVKVSEINCPYCFLFISNFGLKYSNIQYYVAHNSSRTKVEKCVTAIVLTMTEGEIPYFCGKKRGERGKKRKGWQIPWLKRRTNCGL